MKVLWFSNTPANAVGYFNDSTIKGGWLQSLNQLLEQKIELHIAFLNPKGPATFKYGNTFYHSIMPRNWKGRLVLNSFLNLNTDIEDTKSYLDIIEQVRPDIIDIRGSENGYISVVDKTDVPIILDIQGFVNPILNKYNIAFDDKILKSHFYNKGLQKSSFLPKSFYLYKKYFIYKAKREFIYIKYVRNVGGRTNWDRRVSSVMAPNAKYYHIDRFLRNDFYNFNWKKLHLKTFIIHSTSSGSIYKGLETIIETAYYLNKLNFKFQWNIAGVSYNDPLIKLVKSKLKNSYTENSINFLGRLTSEKLIDFMLNSNIYVTTSHIENSPNNLAEAMMLGMPCIATNAGGTSTYIKDGENGILLQDGDPWALAGTILELAGNSALSCEIGKNARETALSRHNKIRIIDDVLGTYSSIVANSK